MKNTRKLVALICLTALVLGILAGCGSSDPTVDTKPKEKLIHVMVSGIVDGESAEATLTGIDTGRTVTTGYRAEGKAFCFLVEENGFYQVDVSADGKQAEEKILSVSDDVDYYFIYINMSE